jgi:hypothetical protein
LDLYFKTQTETIQDISVHFYVENLIPDEVPDLLGPLDLPTPHFEWNINAKSWILSFSDFFQFMPWVEIY